MQETTRDQRWTDADRRVHEAGKKTRADLDLTQFSIERRWMRPDPVRDVVESTSLHWVNSAIGCGKVAVENEAD